MGRKGQPLKSRKPAKTKNQRNKVSKEEKEIQENVDKLLRISTIPQQGNVVNALKNQKEISAIVEQVKKLEINKDSKSSADNRASGATIENFTKWVKENGAQFNGCTITEFKGYDLGIKVNTDIPQSTLVLAIPRKVMLTVERASDSILKNLIKNDQILKNMPNVALAIYLLLEKFTDNSFWKPYLDILPKSYTTVLYFTIEELEELKGSPTLEIALRQIKSIARQYAYFHKLFSTSDDPVCQIMQEKFTYNQYCWAVSTVMTRQNTIPAVNSDQMINALIPLWDLCNHTNGTISTDFNPQLDQCECLALRDFKKNEQLFIFYGARSNADLFIHNGFVFDDNEHDGYWIKLGIGRTDPLQEKRLEVLRKLSINGSADFVIKKGARPVDGKLLAFLRVFNMNQEQLDHWLESDKTADLEYIECALDTVLEKKSWTYLQDRLKLLMASYKTTLEEDLKLIKTDITDNRKLAVKMRISEKIILKETVEYIEQYITQ
ncbi:unnamed protein product [Brassicogethes aeneus]|uniref:protein-histidine N-methyltransferase n=1 Tax=Brassicogethes aeneus TaxID=1431903 RepID=A0A9P0B894_BRAAE|nr:unnamed protein product [Brassicogethes aeneus]